ncbi:MAG: hypothetical protein IT381_24720 [Deltaproteobacteria bacterium]|nr:hypothetical protein [Deltaproteobacteria bacterium]
MTIDSARAPTASATVGADGGEVALGSAKLSIPAGALASEQTIRLTVRASETVGVSKIYSFEPQGLRFATPATLRIAAEPADRLRTWGSAIAHRQSATDKWSPLDTVAAEPLARVFSAEVHHFTEFSLVTTGQDASGFGKSFYTSEVTIDADAAASLTTIATPGVVQLRVNDGPSTLRLRLSGMIADERYFVYVSSYAEAPTEHRSSPNGVLDLVFNRPPPYSVYVQRAHGTKFLGDSPIGDQCGDIGQPLAAPERGCLVTASTEHDLFVFQSLPGFDTDSYIIRCNPGVTIGPAIAADQPLVSTIGVLSSARSTTVHGCTIRGFQTAIAFNGTGRQQVLGGRIFDAEHGVTSVLGDSAYIDGVQMKAMRGTALGIYWRSETEAGGSDIRNNVLEGSILLFGGLSGLSLVSNTFGYFDGQSADARPLGSARIASNTGQRLGIFRNLGSPAARVAPNQSVTVSGNTLNSAGVPGALGIVLGNCGASCAIRGNHIVGMQAGILASGPFVIEKNTIEQSGIGLDFFADVDSGSPSVWQNDFVFSPPALGVRAAHHPAVSPAPFSFAAVGNFWSRLCPQVPSFLPGIDASHGVSDPGAFGVRVNSPSFGRTGQQYFDAGAPGCQFFDFDGDGQNPCFPNRPDCDCDDTTANCTAASCVDADHDGTPACHDCDNGSTACSLANCTEAAKPRARQFFE